MSLLKNKYVIISLRVLGVIAGTLVLLAALATLSLRTESASRALTNYGVSFINGSGDLRLEYGSVTGTLYSGLAFSDLSISHPTVLLQADSLSSSWNFWSLFAERSIVDAVFLNGLQLSLPEQPEASAGSNNSEPLALPAVQIPRVVIQGFATTIDSRLDAERIAGGITIGGNEVAIEELDIDAVSGGAQANLTLTLAAVTAIDLDAEWFLAENLVADLPALSGSTRLQGDLSELAIDLELLTPYNLTTQGTISNPTDVDTLVFDLDHSLLLSNLPQFPPPLHTVELQVSSVGNLEQVQLQAEGNLQFTDLPDHQLQLAGNLSEEQFSLSTLTLQQGSTRLVSELTVSLGATANLDGQFELQSLNPLDYLPAQASASWMPLDINSQGTYAIQDLSADPQVSARIESLQMLAGENDIAGAGIIEWSAQELRVRGFQLDSDSTHITLDGTIGESSDLAWQLDLDDIGQFVADASGSIRGSGALSGSQQNPFVTGSFSAGNLSLAALQVESVAGLVEGSPQSWQADFSVQDVVLSAPSVTETLRSGQLQLSGDSERFAISLSTESEQGSMDLALQGGPLQQNPVQWQGSLVRAEFNAGRNWVLDRSVPLGVSAQRLTMDSTCLNSGATQLCIDIAAEMERGSAELALSLTNYPLQEIPEINYGFPFLSLQNLPALEFPQGVSFRGELDGSAQVSYGANELESLSLSLSSTAPVMAMEFQREFDDSDLDGSSSSANQEYYWQDVALTGAMEDANWTFLATGSLLEQALEGVRSPLQGNLELNLDVAADQTLDGSTRANFDDLGWLEFYLADLSSIKGQLRSDLQLSGSIEQPQLSGFVAISDGGFMLDRWGVRIDQVSGELTASEQGSVSIDARAATADGDISLSGTATNVLAANTTLDLRLTGTDFQLLDSDPLSLRVSPDLSLNASQESIAVSGSLLVPQMRITMDNLPESAIDVSSDVVIVNYAVEDSGVVNSLAAENSRFLNIPITADVDIELGEDVQFDGFGLSTSLAGQLEMELLENGSNRTFGELAITEGSYSLYGQSLQINEGELLFIGPYDNPGLDIVATRTIDEQVVGVQINGTLRNLQSELISTPSLPEAEVVALIATGRPFSELGSTDEAALLGSIARLGLERGRAISDRVRDGLGLDTLAITNTGNINNSLLTVGKFLTPSLFVRYGLGLFDNQSKVAVDYDLTDTLKLQAESGEYQSLDLTYSIER